MIRELNNSYMVPLTPVFPASALGPQGDVAKINCATCHQGVFKPLLGAKMAQNFPELEGDVKPVQAAAPMPAPAAAPATAPATP
jgi:photosynthetic reaction center cytochrome c subunit